MTCGCPICWKSLSSRQKVELECSHALCSSCAREWIFRQQRTCPLCRKPSLYYDRPLRSRKRRFAVHLRFLMFTSQVGYRFLLDGNSKTFIDELTNAFDKMVLREKALWYRLPIHSNLHRWMHVFLETVVPVVAESERVWSSSEKRKMLQIYRDVSIFLKCI